MKPINEYTLQECLEALRTGSWEIVRIAERIRELTRWIPAEERLPSPQDGEPFMGSVLWMWGVGYVEAKSWNNMPPKATHWRRIETL